MINARLVGVAALGFVVSSASGGVVLNVAPVGADVLVSGGGTLDLTNWNYLGSASSSPYVNTGGTVVGVAASIKLYSGNAIGLAALAGPTSFATVATGASTATGDIFGIGVGSGPSGNIVVPAGYTSGASLTGSATYQSATIASLGLSVGTWTWTWNTSNGEGDSFTIHVVPAPASATLLGAVGFLARRQRRG